MKQLLEKQKNLEYRLRQAGKVMVAFSAGVDSTFLLKSARDVLGENVLAVTAVLASFPKKQLQEAEAFCKEYGIRQIFVYPEELRVEGFANNPENRCFLCKKQLFEKILEQADKEKIVHILEGSNADDEKDYRPGAEALRQLNIECPLKDAGFTKEEIRFLSKQMGLSVWNKPSQACLYSRFPYGELLTETKLRMVEEAEEVLSGLGFGQVRVRMHGESARIEVLPSEFAKLIRPDISEEVCRWFHTLGFQYVSMDLSGYRTGSMNETVRK